MIESKQFYKHSKSDMRMQILNESPMHQEHWHVGLILNDQIVMTCHVHKKDITEDWLHEVKTETTNQ